MECALCKVGTTERGKVTITLERDGAIVLIKDVPAEVCTNCGHYYLSEEITRLVMEKGNTAIENGAELEVLNCKSLDSIKLAKFSNGEALNEALKNKQLELNFASFGVRFNTCQRRTRTPPL